jgi:hypothetical protein
LKAEPIGLPTALSFSIDAKKTNFWISQPNRTQHPLHAPVGAEVNLAVGRDTLTSPAIGRGSSVNHHFAEPALATEAQFCRINFQLPFFTFPRVNIDCFGFIADHLDLIHHLDLIRGSILRKSLEAARL